jgi:thiol-disulfide isomerase/thioredoxin
MAARPINAAAVLTGVIVLMQCHWVNGGEIGMEAPPVKVSEWIKGESVQFSEKKDTIYVIEFWATWCGPCRDSIPHLTELQKKFSDDNVTIIGISDEKPDRVRSFVEKMGAKMDYTVAVSSDGFMHEKYMKEFGAMGIPHAFVVNQDHRIVWEGHPLSQLEEVLSKMVEGKFDMDHAVRLAKSRERQAETLKLMEQYFEAVVRGDETPEAAGAARKVLDNAQDNPSLLNQFSWVILTHPQIKHRNVKIALEAAEAAHKASFESNANVADTLARAYFDNGMVGKAVAMQKKAIELAEGNEEKIRAFTGILEKYEKALK